MRTRNIAMLLLGTLLGIGAGAQSVQTAPPPTTLRASEPKQQQPPSQRQPLPPGTRAPQPILSAPAAGRIEGFVYWDANSYSHVPASSCSGLAITVGVGSSSGGPLTAYTPMTTLSNNFKYVGQVKEFLVGGKVNVYDVCAYGYDKVPVGPDLQVTLSVTQRGAFSPMAVPQFATLGPLKINNAQCNMLPRIVNPTPSDLTAHWGSCQDMAYDVNFVMHTAPRPPLALASTAPGSSGRQGGMLSGAPQQGMLSPATTQSAQSQTNSGALLGNRQAATGQSGGMQNPGSKVELNPQPFPPRQQLTNTDVIKMVKAGIRESVIVHSIQSSTKQFNFSPASLQELQQAHVSPAILAAMCDGSARSCPQGLGNNAPATPGSKVGLNPQPFPPRTSMTGQLDPGAQASLNPQPFPPKEKGVSPAREFAPKMPPIKSNPKRDAAPPADSAAITQIRSKLAVQLAASRQRTATLQNVTPKETKSPEIQALHEQKIFIDSLRNQGAPAKDRLVAARAPSSILPGQKPAASDPKLIAPAPLTTMCAGPQIRSVNGATTGVIFTQDPQYNDYIIRGCGFGNQQGQTYLSGALTSGRINLVVKQWTDTQIEAVVQPGLTGVLDGWPDLIVAPASGSPAKFPSCRFYAQRKSVLLNSIPRQYANLANVTVGDSTHGFGTMYCPGPDVSHLFPCVAYNAGPPLDGISNGHDHKNDPSRAVSNAVDRDGGKDQFNSGEDVYDLSSMAPGFEIDDSSVDWYAWTTDVCEGWASDAFPKKPGDSVGYDTEGHYSWSTKTKTKIVVDWGVDHCGWRWLGMFKVDDWYNSGYSLEVYVKGPIGVDPWTGHPVSVVHNFGEEQQPRTVQMR